jgi:hypothetical protein
MSNAQIYAHYCAWCRSLGIPPATMETYFQVTRTVGGAR